MKAGVAKLIEKCKRTVITGKCKDCAFTNDPKQCLEYLKQELDILEGR